MRSPIFDSFNENRSKSGNNDICINLFPEKILDGNAQPTINLLLGRPGLTAPLCTIGTGPVRGMFSSNNGLLYVVSGNGLYSVNTSWASTFIGTIGSLTGPVSIIESPTQILVVDGTGGWCWNFQTSTFSQVIPNAQTSDTNPNTAIYQDGFGIVNSGGTNQIYQSNYNDLSTFAQAIGGGGSTANNAYVQSNPKNVLAMYDLNQEAWIFKKDATEIWINQGNAGFAFVQLQGVHLPVGILAPASIARVGDSILWLGASDTGEDLVYQSEGYHYKNITTPYIAAQIASYPVDTDAIAYSYQMEGHFFYVITFPTQGVTWAYDATTGKWTQRAVWNNGSYQREIPNCHALYSGTHAVGDYQNGNIYALSNGVYTDNGLPIRWQRSWDAIPESLPKKSISFDSMQIMLETGITVPVGTNPQIDLRFSDDGGYTWNGPFQMPAGQTGYTTWRAIQNRLGSTSLTRGMERVWEISGNDPYSVKITGAEWEGGPA